MSSPTLRILRRSLRLPQLKQGGTLSIAASRLAVPDAAAAENTAPARHRPPIPPLTVRIVPGWRDDAEIELWQQIYVDGERAAAGAAAAPAGERGNVEEEIGNRHITDGLVVGLGARINDGDECSAELPTAESAALDALGRRFGDVSLCLDLEAALRQSSPSDHDLAEEIDVQDMEIPVEYDDEDDDEEEEGEESMFSTIDGNHDEESTRANYEDSGSNETAQDDLDSLFECSDDHGLSSLTLIASVPEKVNLKCHLEGAGNIVVEGKVEGQHGFDLRAARGNVKVKKLRGDSVRLFAGAGSGRGSGGGDGTAEADRPTGIVYATDLVEARSVSIEAEGRMRAKMVNGTDINLAICDSDRGVDDDDTATTYYAKPLEVDDTGALIDIGSLYTTKNGNGANVEVIGNASQIAGSSAIPRAVRIKSSHGHVSVTTSLCEDSIESNNDEFDQKIPIVELGGVNGSCDVILNRTAEKANASDAPSGPEKSSSDESLSARVHVDSLTPDSVSFVSAGLGNVELTVDRKVESDLRLVSSRMVSDIDADALLVDDEDGVRNECERLDNLSSANKAANDPTSVITGTASNRIYVQTNSFTQNHNEMLPNETEYVEGSIHNRSFEPDSRFDVKTKHSSAAPGSDINKGIGKVNIMGAAAQALSGFSGKKGGEQSPLFVVASSGRIKVETVSWFGAIARRYGMEDQSRKDIGRTASREGRLK